ncbi:YALIA101S11e04258g1_1 [Yarrowia lipolytica]|nr:YALIA101S11e04258g1_1 [Yarrowia lipolytica]VBB88075.1 Hypothetical protein conserved in the Yarrowia clade [Yarrowia lipolytica]
MFGILRRSTKTVASPSLARGYRRKTSNNPFAGFTRYIDTSYVPMLFFIGFMFSATINVSMAKHDYDELDRKMTTQIEGLKGLIKRVEAGEKVDVAKERELWSSSAPSKDVQEIFEQIRDSTVEPEAEKTASKAAPVQDSNSKPLSKFI